MANHNIPREGEGQQFSSSSADDSSVLRMTGSKNWVDPPPQRYECVRVSLSTISSQRPVPRAAMHHALEFE